MGLLKQIRGYLITGALVAACLKIILWAVLPLLPYMVGGIILLSALGFIFSIMWRRSSKL
jgi:hypothetical protein